MPVYDLFYHISALPGTILFLFFSLPLNFVYISILIKKLLWLSSSCSCSFPETSLNRSIAFCSNAFAFFTSFSSHMSLERPLSQSETSFFKRLITICICAGVFAMLAFQIIVNIGMCLMVLPVIGVTLPFLSYGGTSVLSAYISLGLVMLVYGGDKKSMFGE